MKPSPEQANQMIDRGYPALAPGFDWVVLRGGASAPLDGVKRVRG